MAAPARPKVSVYDDPAQFALDQSAFDLHEAMNRLRAQAKKHVSLARKMRKLDSTTTRFAADVLLALPKTSDKDDTTIEVRDLKIHATRYATARPWYCPAS
jgi:hypothetical protein